MAKFYGMIGYAKSEETARGVYSDDIIERPYQGDYLRRYKRWDNNGSLSDDINISNQISIIADPFANENIGNMRYVVDKGCKWKITSVDINYPRLILDIGGVYNE